jgi:hypothetical protein
VNSDAAEFVVHLLKQLHVFCVVVPQADRVVAAASSNQRPPEADVHIHDASPVEGLEEIRKSRRHALKAIKINDFLFRGRHEP